MFGRLFGARTTKRPEIEALLDAELERHNQALRKLVNYAIEQETDNGEQTNAG